MVICLPFRPRGPARLFPLLAYNLVSLENPGLDVRGEGGNNLNWTLDLDGEARIFKPRSEVGSL